MENRIQKLIQKFTFVEQKPHISIYARNHHTTKAFGYHEHDNFGTASIIKIAIALAIFDKAKKRNLDLDAPIQLPKNMQDLGTFTTGVLAFFPKNTKISLRTLCFYMLRMSDNAATNVLLTFISQKEVNSYLTKNNFKHTKLTAAFLNPERLLKEKNLLGTTTAYEMTHLFGQIASGKLIESKKDADTFMQMMEPDTPEKSYSRYLPVLWNVPENMVKAKILSAKHGAFPHFELRSDSVLLKTDKNELISLSVYTQGIQQKNGSAYPTNLHVDHPAVIFIAEATKILFDYLY